MSKQKQKYTYDQIQPLVVHEEVERNRIYVEFQLPGSDEVHESQAPLRKIRDTKSEVNRVVKRTAANQARRGVTRAIRGALGGGMVGRTSTQAFQVASRHETQKMVRGATSQEKEQAIVEAFLKVEEHFHWDEASQEWTRPATPPPPKALSAYETELKNNPIDTKYDRQIFARILAELANADGNITPEEKEFFQAVIPTEYGALETLLQGDPVSAIEAQEVGHGAKRSIYMLAWAISLVDMDLDPVEQELLMEYAEMFGLGDDIADDLIKKAKYSILERSIDPDISRQELFDLADQIDLSHDEAERCKIGMIKRS